MASIADFPLRALSIPAFVFALACCTRASAQSAPIVLDGNAPDGPPDHFLLPFAVPAGTKEIRIEHTNPEPANILDWGLLEPAGFRGWGGGNSEPAVVSERAASRSYLPGAITAGTWHVVVGKAKIGVKPARYHIEVTLGTSSTLPAQPERRAYAPVPALEHGARWYAGDFHVHSRESGDAHPTLDEVADFAASRGLDFVLLSEHNTTSQLSFYADVQARHPHLLLLPGVEWTTYAGHANAIGATAFIDHKVGMPGVTAQAAVDAAHAQRALFSINHPTFELGNLCIGCAWHHDLPASSVDAVEIANGGWDKAGQLFSEGAIAFWDGLCAQGAHVAALGGSDDHRAGRDESAIDSPIGNPTTLVYADELSVDGILRGVRARRTVVKLQGPADPMLELDADVPLALDVVRGSTVTFRAKVSGGAGQTVRFVRDGVAEPAVAVSTDPFMHTLTLEAPEAGETRVRAELLVNGKPRTVTSHLWLQRPVPAAPSAGDADDVHGGGCACELARPVESGQAWYLAALSGLLGLWLARRHLKCV